VIDVIDLLTILTIQPFNHSTIQPFNHSTIQPFNHSTHQHAERTLQNHCARNRTPGQHAAAVVVVSATEHAVPEPCDFDTVSRYCVGYWWFFVVFFFFPIFSFDLSFDLRPNFSDHLYALFLVCGCDNCGYMCF
jgi:hypothetical protein